MHGRRQFLAATGLGSLALALGSRSSRADPADGRPCNLIMVFASGGWDVTYALDPKPGLAGIDAPEGEIVDFSGLPIFTSPERPNVTTFFERFAPLTTLVHGIQVQSVVHADCFKRILTGTPSDTAPDFGAIVAHESGRELAAPYLVLGNTSFAGPYASLAARAGTANQLTTLLRPTTAFPVDGQGTFRFYPEVGEADLIRRHVAGRAERELGRRGGRGNNAARLQAFVEAIGRADSLRDVGTFGDFDYTRDLSVQARLAVDALDTGLARVVQLEAGDFDTHEDNTRQTYEHETLFGGLTQLVEQLQATPGASAGQTLLDETMVVVLSEMGRTPKLNDANGKDHWPITSAMVLGPRVPGGRLLGATDDNQLSVPLDLTTGEASSSAANRLQYGNFVAGLLHAVGVDPAAHLPSVEPLRAITG